VNSHPASAPQNAGWMGGCLQLVLGVKKSVSFCSPPNRQVKAGDFILSNSMSFGRPYILKIDGCIHDGWLAIQNYQNTFDVDYLYYLLGSDMVFTQYIGNAAGSSVKNLNKDIVAKIRLPAPSLSEQRKIAKQITAIDKVLDDCRKQLDKAQSLKHGMMLYFFG